MPDYRAVFAPDPKPWEMDWSGRTSATAPVHANPVSPDNPFADLVTRPVASARVPSSGVTVVPKGGVPRERLDFRALFAPDAPAPGQDIALADVPAMAAENLVPSAKRFASDIAHAATDPVGTGKALLNVVTGTAEKLVPGEQSHEGYADAVGQFFMERYGGIDNLKRTMAKDPVGFLADMATVLTGGQLALARAPGMAGQIGRAAGTTSRAIDPINASLKAAGAVGRGIGQAASSAVGVATGTGGAPLRTAARAGLHGGEAARALRENMRGAAPMEAVVADAKAALSAVKAERSAAYKASMADVRADTKALNLGKVEDALKKVRTEHTFKGVSVSPAADRTIQEVATVLDEWRRLDPAEFHTAAGFDALKRRIGDIRESAQYGTPARRAADQVYNVIKNQITAQAPHYAKTMRNYERASSLIREMEKTLSLNPKASVDTSLRKLQSVMRNNVNTNYGKRADLVKLLQEHGATHILEKLAGQALSSIEPRGLSRMVAGLSAAGGAGVLGAGAFGLANPLMAVPLAGQLALQSPRLMGEAAYLGGRTANYLRRAPVRNALMTGYQLRGADLEGLRP
jgi:hypothetical protein